MANARGRAVDTTCLSTHGFLELRGVIHRDYLAHVLRFSKVARYLYEGRRHQTAHVLDVGCGREAPLAALLYHGMMTHTTGSYTGIDAGPVDRSYYLKKDHANFHATWLAGADLAVAELPRAQYDVIVMLEVAEHVEGWHAYRLLRRIRKLLAPGGAAFVSTPCYDAATGAAANHVNELTRGAFRTLLEAAGLEVRGCWGTFASWHPTKQALAESHPELLAVAVELQRYYATEVMACLFAPLVPEVARNCLWQVAAGTPTPVADPYAFADASQGSSALWPDHAWEIHEAVHLEDFFHG